MMNWIWHERSSHSVICDFIPEFSEEGLTKTTKTRQDCRVLGGDLNPEYTEYEAGILFLTPLFHVTDFSFFLFYVFIL
jgi:hypothetical protein